MVGGSAGQMAGEFAQRFTAGVVSQRIRMAVYNQGKLDYASIAADAFGNQLGQGLVDAMKPGYSAEEMAGDFQRENNRFAAAAQAAAAGQRTQYGFDVPMQPIDYSLAPTGPVDLGTPPGEGVAQWSADIDAMIRNGGSNSERALDFLFASTADSSGTVGARAPLPATGAGRGLTR